MSQLRMIRQNLDKLPEIKIPKDYEIRTYKLGDEAHWAEIINASFGGERSAEDAKSEIMDKPEFAPEKLFFATYQSKPVGTACAWYKFLNETKVGYLHMIGVMPEHQGLRLGKWLSLCVLHFFKKQGFPKAILDTDDHRLPAIKTYLNLGFEPLYREDSHQERWRVVFEKLGL